MSRVARAVADRRLFVLSTSLLTCWSGAEAARADESASPTIGLPPVVVSATLVPTPESQLGSSVTVIGAREIEQKQNRTLPEVLNDVPGLNVVQTGSPGGVTSVFIRGTNANHTKVYIDGIDVGDPSAPNGAFDFSQ